MRYLVTVTEDDCHRKMSKYRIHDVKTLFDFVFLLSVHSNTNPVNLVFKDISNLCI